MRPGRRLLGMTVALAMATCLATLAESGERPASVPLSEVEVSIVSVAVGLLDEGCEFGSHEARFLIRGTGHAQFEFEILGREDCPVDVREFELTQDEVEELLNGLWSVYFFDLAPRYSGLPGVSIGHDAGSAGVRAIDMITVVSHSLDVTVRIRFGDVEHSVRFDHGARVPGLTPLIQDWLPQLWLRSGFRRHLPPEERGDPERP